MLENVGSASVPASTVMKLNVAFMADPSWTIVRHEPHDDLRTTLAHLITLRGHRVEETTHLYVVADRIAAIQPHAVIMDVDGLLGSAHAVEVIEALRDRVVVGLTTSEPPPRRVDCCQCCHAANHSRQQQFLR